MKIKFAALLCLSLTGTLLAAPETFDFKTTNGVNNANFKLVAPLETINGNANGISGTVTFDPENVAITKGKIVIAASSLTVPNPMMKQHLLGAQWLEASKYPEITFETKEVKNAKTEGEKTTADVTGTFTLKGVAKEITVPVSFDYKKDKLSAQDPNKKGDLLVLRATFSIQRSDFNVNAHKQEDKVSDKIELTLGIAGASPK